ncbi:MAG: outer membrane beta-barrel protein [Candidatus Omnitrophica bacterium]|nr:outer membrane beta-barrel protein [Candidatus Omnitrophota bacterium]
MNTSKVILSAVLFSLLAVPLAHAQTYREEGIRIGAQEFKDMKGVRIGSARLKAGVSTEGQYDSNIFLTSSDKKHDYISITSPEFLLDLPLGLDERHLVQFMYKADAAAFSDYKSQNYVNQDAAANVNLRLPFGYFNINNDYKNTSDRANSDFTDLVRRKENRAETILGIEANKLTYEVGYAELIKRYYKEAYQTLEYNEQDYTGTVFYQLMPKTKALVEYQHGAIDYSKDAGRDGYFDQEMIGLRGQLTGKTVGLIKGGYQKRIYTKGSAAGYESFVAEAGIISTLSSRTEVTAKVRRNAVESVYSTNNYYNANTAIVSLTQKLINRWTFLGSSRFDLNEYPDAVAGLDKARRDAIITENVALRYDMKSWAKATLGYQYKEDISNVDTLKYTDNLFSLRCDLLM